MKMRFLLLSILVLVLSACHSGEKEGSMDEGGGIYAAIASNPSEIIVSKSQFEAGGMKIGQAHQTVFDQHVVAGAYLRSSPGSASIISSSIPGKITAVYVSEGDRLSKGQAMFAMSGKEIILLQQEYAKAVYRKDLLEENFERQKQLDENMIGARKEFLKVENDLKVAGVSIKSLRAQLALLNIDFQAVEAGDIKSEIIVVSPMSGLVTSPNLTIGRTVDSNVELLEVVDPDGLCLEIRVFKKNLDLLALGQKVKILADNKYLQDVEAVISKIGRTIDEETRSITCIASLGAEESRSFAQNQFVEVNVIICQREVMVISEEALLLEDGRYYVLALEKEDDEQYQFSKKQVEIGVLQQGNAELLVHEGLGDILVNGGYIMPTE